MKLKSQNPHLKIYGVEPHAANGMFLSLQVKDAVAYIRFIISLNSFLQNDKAMKTPGKQSIASGLSPPFVGENAFQIVRKFCQGILLISEVEICQTVKAAFDHGLVVEPAGAAALAALLFGKVNLKSFD